MAPKTQTSLASFFGAPKAGGSAKKPTPAKKLKENADNQTDTLAGATTTSKSEKKHVSHSNSAKEGENLQRKKRRVIDDDDDDEEDEKDTSTTPTTTACAKTDDTPMEVEKEEKKDSGNTFKDAKQTSKAPKAAVKAEDVKSDKDTEHSEDDTKEQTRAASALLALAPKDTVASDAKLLEEIPDTAWPADSKALPYLFLCQSLSEIEATTKRLQIQSILTKLLRQVLLRNPADLYPLIYLASNSVAPAYECVELGIGDSLLIKAIGEATGTNANMVKSKYETVGDLGTVAMTFKGKQKTLGGFFQSSSNKPKPKLSANEVLAVFREIAQTKGNQAQKWKVDKIKKLLVKATDPTETKYIIRGLQGKLRIGLAESTVLISLAHSLALTTPTTVKEPEEKLKKCTCTHHFCARRSKIQSGFCHIHSPRLFENYPYHSQPIFQTKYNATWKSHLRTRNAWRVLLTLSERLIRKCLLTMPSWMLRSKYPWKCCINPADSRQVSRFLPCWPSRQSQFRKY